MADNFLTAKWNVHNPYEETSPEAKENFVQFFKDGSCIVPAALIGGDEDSAFVYLFYQAFENGTIRFEPAGGGADICFYKIEGDILCIKPISDKEFRYFARESKKSFLKARVAALGEEAPKKAKEAPPEREAEEHEWKCPKCGKINQNYVGTCGCGEPKPHDKPFNWLEVHPELVKEPEPEPIPEPEPEPEPEKPKKDAPPEREPEEHEWKCPSCGKINQNYVGTCGCGAPKPNNKLFNWAEVHPELVKKPEPEPIPEPEPEPEPEKPKKDAPPEREPEAHEWKCPSCGKINQNYVGTCGCGEPKPNDKLFNWAEVHPELVKKPEPEPEPEPAPAPAKKQKPEKEKPAEPERVPLEHEWKCPKCGKINQNYVGTCGCGEPKPHDKPFNWAEVHPELAKKPEPAPAPVSVPSPGDEYAPLPEAFEAPAAAPAPIPEPAEIPAAPAPIPAPDEVPAAEPADDPTVVIAPEE